jgi:uncharacterized integral membrane protein
MLVFILFALGVVLGGLTVVFSLQNIGIVTVSFFSWQLEGSLSLILMLATLAGAIIAFLMLLPGSVRGYFRHRALIKENARLGEELRKQKELTHFARKEPATQDALSRIEDGAIEKPREERAAP